MNSGGFENETKYLEMAVDGSLEAFNHLVTYYQTAVYNTALRIMCDASRADDITQTISATPNRISFRNLRTEKKKTKMRHG